MTKAKLKAPVLMFEKRTGILWVRVKPKTKAALEYLTDKKDTHMSTVIEEIVDGVIVVNHEIFKEWNACREKGLSTGSRQAKAK